MDNKPWYTSRTVIAGFIAFLFAVANMIGITPSGISQEHVVAAVMAVTSAVAIVFRYKADFSDPSKYFGPDTKPWYQSKTIVVNLVAAVFAVLAVFNWVPSDLSQEEVVNAILGIVGVATVVFRIGASQPIGK